MTRRSNTSSDAAASSRKRPSRLASGDHPADDPAAAAAPPEAADRAALAGFLDAIWLEDGLSLNTLEAYRRDLSMLAVWLATRPATLTAANQADLQAYIAERHAASRPTSSNRRLTVFRRFYRWLVREHQRPDDPTQQIVSARQSLRFPKSLSQAQVEALLAAPDISTALGLRDRAMLETLYATGLRVS